MPQKVLSLSHEPVKGTNYFGPFYTHTHIHKVLVNWSMHIVTRCRTSVPAITLPLKSFSLIAMQSLAIGINGPWLSLINNYYQLALSESHAASGRCWWWTEETRPGHELLLMMREAPCSYAMVIKWSAVFCKQEEKLINLVLACNLACLSKYKP